MKNIYIISGLGADKSVFSRLDFGENNIVFIDWIPVKENEPIIKYAQRLLAQITTPNPILIGLSFGGIMAVEIAKLIPVEKLILISSAKTKYEIPFSYRLLGKLKLNKILPVKLFFATNQLTYFIFGVKEKRDQAILSANIKNTNIVFFRWAINQILNWENTENEFPIFHLHGNKDYILPFSKIKNAVEIIGGGHLMVLTHPAEVSTALIGNISAQ